MALLDRFGRPIRSGSGKPIRTRTDNQPKGNASRGPVKTHAAPTAKITKAKPAHDRGEFALVDTATAPPPTEIVPVEQMPDADFERHVLRHGLSKRKQSAATGKLAPTVEDWSTQHIDLNRYKALGFPSQAEAYQAYQNMMPEERAIFESYENPSASDKFAKGLVGGLIPGAGLIGGVMWKGQKTLKDKIDYAKRTAATVARNKQSRDSQVASTSSQSPTRPTTSTAPASHYASLDSYRNLFNNYKF